MAELTWADYAWKLLPILLVFGGVLSAVPLLVYLERKIAAFIQDRVGPNRVGLLGPDGLAEGVLGWRGTKRRVLGGLLQPIADAVKLMAKEDIVPARADRFLYTLGPFFALIPPLLMFVVVPVGADLMLPWRKDPLPMQVADLNVGVLWVLSVASLSVYGVALGGWASNNKYSLLGGVRATAQMISYEIGLGLVILCMAMQYGTVSLREMVEQQAAGWWGIARQPLAFVLFVVCAFAENNRLPFDMPECETELIGGYHTEYSSLKFGMFMQGEYIAMMAMGALVATLFLGGWHFPGYGALSAAAGGNPWAQAGVALLSLAAFGLKVLLFLFVQMWVRWTLPRFRYDQLMRLGWKVVIPLGLANMVLTALVNLPAGR